MKHALLAALALSLAPGLVAAGERCTEAEFSELLKLGTRYADWKSLHHSYVKFRQCDDGGESSEGYSEAVARLLADRWQGLHELDALITSDKEFGAFVLKHIDATVADEDLSAILGFSDENCPKNLEILCSQIRDRAKSAIRESAEAWSQK